MECSLQEVMPEINSRSVGGRVVVNPPGVMGPRPFKPRETGTIYMCCTRAFLTKASFEKHLAEKEEHSKPIDFNGIPRSSAYGEQSGYGRAQHNCTEWSDMDDADGDLTANFENNYGINDPVLSGETTVTNSVFKHGRFINHGSKMQDAKVRMPSSVSIKQALIARAKKQLIFPKLPYKKPPVGYCSFCNKGFSSKLGLSDHMNTHTGAKPYKCEICKFRFSHSSNYKRHLKKSHGKHGVAKCNICDCTFTSNYLLARHMTIMHPKKSKIEKIQSPQKQTDFKDEPALTDIPLPNLKLQHPPPSASGRYKCHVCNKKLTSPQAWRHHMLIHQNIKPNKCTLCGIYFRLPGTLRNHIKTSHADGMYRCNKCTCRYNCKNALSRHIRLYHSKKSNIAARFIAVQKLTRNEAASSPNITNVDILSRQCHLCFKIFNARIPKELHIKRAHGDGRHKCQFCCCRYTCSKALFNHLVKEHNMKRSDWDFNLKCVKSTATTFSRNAINATDDANGGEKENLKSDNPNNSRNYQPGETAETGLYNYTCDICNKGFMWRGSVFNHKRKAHNLFSNKFGCPSCPLEFQKIGWLQKHQETVHGFVEPPKILEANNVESNKMPSSNDSKRFVKCLICDKLLSRNSLPAHMVTHTRGDKLFECNLCKMKFRNPSSIHTHKKKAHLHNGKIKCSQCSCKFMVKSGLIAHRRIFHSRFAKIVDPNLQNNYKIATGVSQQNISPQLNSTEKSEPQSQYQCIQCDQWFSDMESFRKHVSVHTSGKKFECNMCHLKFAHRSGVMAHKTTSHFHDGSFGCLKCSCKFLTLAGLASHKKIHHAFVCAKKKKLNNRSIQDSPSNQLATNVTQNKPEKTLVPIEPKWQCQHCKKVLSNKKNYKAHMIVHVGEVAKKYKCDLCGLKFADLGKLPLHKKRAHDHDGKFQCPDCSCKFQNALGLSAHRGSHHKLKTTRLVEDLRRPDISTVTEHVNNPSTFTTSKLGIQDRKLNLINTLSRARLATHSGGTGPKRYECELCHLKFSDSGTVPKHKKLAHNHNGKFQCPDCSCKFQSALGLSRHRVSHHRLKSARLVQNVGKPDISTGNKGSDVNSTSIVVKTPLKIPCAQCNFLFSRHSLPLHVKKSHNHNGTFHCPNCTCKFHNQEGVSRHRVLYHGYKKPVPVHRVKSTSLGLLKKSLHRNANKLPVICKICGIKVCRLDYLDQHIKNAHSNGSYKCNQCCCCFFSPIGLAKHVKLHIRKTKVIKAEKMEREIVDPSTEINQTNEDDELPSETGTLTKASKVNRNFLKILSMSAAKIDASKSTSRKSLSRKCHKDLSNDKIPLPSKKKKNRIVCTLCGARFGSAMFYERHMGRAHTDGKYECDKCICTFHSTMALGAHRRVYHNTLGKIVTNFLAHKISTDNTDLSSSSKISKLESNDAFSSPKRATFLEDSPASSFAHNTPDITSPNKKSQISDLAITSESRTDKTSNKEQSAPMSERKLSKSCNSEFVATFPCEFCPKTFSTFSDHRRHTLSHTRPQLCMKCGMRFRTNDEVNKHTIIAHSGGQFKCQLCNCSYNTNFGLRQHVKMIHERESASFSNVTIENEQDEPAGEQEVMFFQDASNDNDDQSMDIIDDESEPIIEGFYGTGYSEALLSEPIVVGFSENPSSADEKDIEGNENIFQGEYAPIIIQEDEYVEESVPEDIPIENLESIVINNLVSPPALNVSNNKKKGFSPKSRPIKCSACGVTCHGPEKLRQHMESHVDSPSPDTVKESHVKVYKCEKCGLEYKTFLEKAEHLKMDHDETGQYRCAYCPCTMKTETVLQYHFMKHHSMRS